MEMEILPTFSGYQMPFYSHDHFRVRRMYGPTVRIEAASYVRFSACLVQQRLNPWYLQILVELLRKLFPNVQEADDVLRRVSPHLCSLDWLCFFAENPNFFGLAKLALLQPAAANPDDKMKDGWSPLALAERHLRNLVRWYPSLCIAYGTACLSDLSLSAENSN